MESTATVQDLFKRWRNEGDAQAGMEMAQKFSDWYYAITAARLGDRSGRPPLESACQAFEQGIVQVTRTGDLVDWAHSLVDRAMHAAGDRVPGGDFPNALTGNRSPTALLQAVRGRLSPTDVDLLALTFDPHASLDDLSARAEQQGGMPHAILQARYALKRLLRDQAQVPLQVVPELPNLDLAPLPLYEGARMATREEEASFEKWLLSDIELCKDVAEFAAFAHALRGGAFAGGSGVAARDRSAGGTVAPPVAPDHPRTVEPALATEPAPDAPPVIKTASSVRLPLSIGLILVFALIVFVAVVALLVLR